MAFLAAPLSSESMKFRKFPVFSLLIGNFETETSSQTRGATTCPFAGFRLLPAAQQEVELFTAPDEDRACRCAAA